MLSQLNLFVCSRKNKTGKNRKYTDFSTGVEKAVESLFQAPVISFLISPTSEAKSESVCVRASMLLYEVMTVA